MGLDDWTLSPRLGPRIKNLLTIIIGLRYLIIDGGLSGISARLKDIFSSEKLLKSSVDGTLYSSIFNECYKLRIV